MGVGVNFRPCTVQRRLFPLWASVVRGLRAMILKLFYHLGSGLRAVRRFENPKGNNDLMHLEGKCFASIPAKTWEKDDQPPCPPFWRPLCTWNFYQNAEGISKSVSCNMYLLTSDALNFVVNTILCYYVLYCVYFEI